MVQLLVNRNGPVMLAVISVRARSPLLVRVTVCGAKFGRYVAAKVKDVGDRESVGAAAPVPVSCTDWVPASSTMVSAPVAGPACRGEFHL